VSQYKRLHKVYPNEAQDNEKNGFLAVEKVLGRGKSYGTLEPFV